LPLNGDIAIERDDLHARTTVTYGQRRLAIGAG
jgi:hypothetical protein